MEATIAGPGPRTGRPPNAPNELLVIARDFGFEAPGSIEAGVTDIRLVNVGAETHQAALVRLENGVTADAFMQTIESDLGKASELGTFVGGPNAAAPDSDSRVTIDLEAGHYLVLCLIPSPKDGEPHVRKGMRAEIDVVPPIPVPAATERPPAETIRLHDFSFEIPKGYNGGGVDVLNVGTQAHELVIGRLHDGAGIADIAAATRPLFQPQPAPPYDPVGGTTPIAPGERVHLDVKLAPGRYAIVCLMPDEKDFTVDHLQRGMGTVLTVH